MQRPRLNISMLLELRWILKHIGTGFLLSCEVDYCGNNLPFVLVSLLSCLCNVFLSQKRQNLFLYLFNLGLAVWPYWTNGILANLTQKRLLLVWTLDQHVSKPVPASLIYPGPSSGMLDQGCGQSFFPYSPNQTSPDQKNHRTNPQNHEL